MNCCGTHEGHEEHKNQRHESGKKINEHNHETKEHEHAPSESGSLKKHYILLAIVGILLIFSVVQAVQLSSARIDIAVAQATGGASISGGTQGVSAPAQSTPTPTMVGGC